jgi:DMSO/TMAO reductase YedYZ molybdopterin-dependent catalytic subunit
MPGNGYPVRLLLPGYQGNMNVKHVRRIKLIDQPAMSDEAKLTRDEVGRHSTAYGAGHYYG